MSTNTLFLRFSDQQEACAVLKEIGIKCCAYGNEVLRLPCDGQVDGIRYTLDLLFASGTLHHPTDETASFEGEPIALTRPTPGFHVNLSWDGPVPDALRSHLLSAANLTSFP